MRSRLGLRFTIAEDGAAAAEAVRTTPVDLVLLEWQMPVLCRHWPQPAVGARSSR
jgi:CheY-like chemotaxis protein